jgi:hypothetical protein
METDITASWRTASQRALFSIFLMWGRSAKEILKQLNQWSSLFLFNFVLKIRSLLAVKDGRSRCNYIKAISFRTARMCTIDVQFARILSSAGRRANTHATLHYYGTFSPFTRTKTAHTNLTWDTNCHSYHTIKILAAKRDKDTWSSYSKDTGSKTRHRHLAITQ